MTPHFRVFVCKQIRHTIKITLDHAVRSEVDFIPVKSLNNMDNSLLYLREKGFNIIGKSLGENCWYLISDTFDKHLQL